MRWSLDLLLSTLAMNDIWWSFHLSIIIKDRDDECKYEDQPWDRDDWCKMKTWIAWEGFDSNKGPSALARWVLQLTKFDKDESQSVTPQNPRPALADNECPLKTPNFSNQCPLQNPTSFSQQGRKRLISSSLSQCPLQSPIYNEDAFFLARQTFLRMNVWCLI